MKAELLLFAAAFKDIAKSSTKTVEVIFRGQSRLFVRLMSQSYNLYIKQDNGWCRHDTGWYDLDTTLEKSILYNFHY